MSRLCMFHPLDHPMERGWVGRIDGQRVVHLAAQTLQTFLTGGGSAREHAAYPLDSVRLLAPVLHPPAVRIFEDQTSFGFANPAAIVGPEREVSASALLARLAAVIGADGALGGFTIFAEWRRPGSSPPKDRDFAFGLGPTILTPDELDPDGLEAVVRVDGEDRLRGRFDGFAWGAARQLAADRTKLYAGDLLVGPSAGPVEAIRPGSAVEIDVDGIGVLRHVVGED